jgi:hypothetical protein
MGSDAHGTPLSEESRSGHTTAPTKAVHMAPSELRGSSARGRRATAPTIVLLIAVIATVVLVVVL